MFKNMSVDAEDSSEIVESKNMQFHEINETF
jgi:hypothetical protein